MPKAKSPKRSGASEIEPGVFVGGWKDAETFVGSRFCVLDELPPEGAPAEGHVPIYDPTADAPLRANLDRLVRLVDDARKADRRVLLFCGHGVRRSPLAGAWYLHRHAKISLDEAYRRVGAVRSGVEPARSWIGRWKELEEPAPGPGRAR